MDVQYTLTSKNSLPILPANESNALSNNALSNHNVGVIRKMPVEHPGVAMKLLPGLLESRGIRVVSAHELLHHVLPDESGAALVPVRDLPEMPAGDAGADAGALGPQAVQLAAGEALHDRVRFPKREIAVDHTGVLPQRLIARRSGMRDWTLHRSTNASSSGISRCAASTSRRVGSVRAANTP